MHIALIGYEANVKNRVGSNEYAFQLMAALYQLDRKNDYTVFLPTPPLADLPPERPGWRYRVSGPGRLWNLIGLPLALYRHQPRFDIVFNPGHYAPLLSPAPLVISVMDLGFLRYPDQFTRPIFLKLKYWTAWSARRARKILAISRATKNDLVKFYGLAADKIAVTYLGFGCDLRQQTVSSAAIDQVKKRFGIAGDYLLFLSTLKPNKNIEGLLEAFALVLSTKFEVRSKDKKSQHSELKLVVAGRKGWLFERIFEKVKALGLEDRVIFTDFVTAEEADALMRGASVFVLPSFWEGFGIPVLNAMAAGTPVVTSNVGSLPEVAGDAAVLVDPAKPEDIAAGIEKALGDRKKLVEKGKIQAAKFSWEKCARETLTALTETVRK